MGRCQKAGTKPCNVSKLKSIHCSLPRTSIKKQPDFQRTLYYVPCRSHYPERSRHIPHSLNVVFDIYNSIGQSIRNSPYRRWKAVLFCFKLLDFYDLSHKNSCLSSFISLNIVWLSQYLMVQEGFRFRSIP